MPDEIVGLPIVDVSGLSSSDLDKRKRVGAELRKACLQYGFFYCAGHGIPQGFIEGVFEESQKFFALPQAEKNAIDKVNSLCNRGYQSLQGQTLQEGAKPDLKEGFYMGKEVAADSPEALANQFNSGPNQWPDNLPGFRPTMYGYYAALIELSERLMRGLALSLDLAETYFDESFEDPAAILRLLHYPPQPENASENEFGAGAHTDFGGITLLLQDDNGGLEVWDIENEYWIDANPIPNTFVVNLGDMFARWTNDKYRSTLHRVINRSGNERYSAPFFYNGNSETIVSCIETCLAEGEEPNYPPIKISDHLKERFQATYNI